MFSREKLEKIVGAENLFDAPDILQDYSGDMSFAPGFRPACVVKAGSADEVIKIIKWANETGTPLIPISSGPPHFRGDTVPSVGGAVIVDLSGMKKIIRVDERNIQAMVEPGVTFGELIQALEKENLAPFMPLAPRSTKSVSTTLLEMDPMIIPRFHWETSEPMGCVEVVYGTGDIIMTGSAALPGTLQEQWELGRAQLMADGPGAINFTKLVQAAQGTMGIITWTSMKCKRLPKVKSPFLIPSDNLEKLIELAYKLCWKRLDGECLLLSSSNLASLMGKDPDEILKLQKILPPWVLIFNLEGGGIMPEEKVSYQEAELIETAQMYGLEPMRSVPGARAEAVAEVISRPSEEPYWKLSLKGGVQDLFFITTMDRTPEFIKKVKDLATAYRYPIEDIGVYLQPIMQGGNCHCEFNFMYDPEDQEETEKVKRFIFEGAGDLANMGAFFSRPYGPLADIAYGRAPHTMGLHKKVKNIFDPNWIMNPGKLCF